MPRWLKARVSGPDSQAADADLVALRAVHGHPRRVMTTAELAAALDVAEDEAAARISTLTDEGYVSLPMQVRSTQGEWSGIGVELTEAGRDFLGAE